MRAARYSSSGRIPSGRRRGVIDVNDGLTDEQRALALGWYGYGRWSAKCWFVGIEPGGDELDACVRMWNALGRAELLDIQAHHEEHDRDWSSDKATRPQPTWQKLIWLVLYYEGTNPDPPAVLDYQKRLLGRSDGDTAILEISAIPAYDNAVERPRLLYRAQRIEKLAQRMREYEPEFVVFYSPDNGPGRRYVDAWNAIVGSALTRDVPVMVGRTACVMTYHPNGARGKDYWYTIASALRAVRKATRSAG